MSSKDSFPAANDDNIQKVLQLLDVKEADVNSTDANYGSALGAAAYGGSKEIVSLLLDRGADVNGVGGSFGGYCGTALAAASCKGYREILSRLLEYPGTDVNAIGGQYGTALGAVFAAAAPTYTDKSLDMIKILLAHGADINLVDCMYGSLFGKAAYNGDKELVWLLLAGGTDVFHVGGQYETVTGEYPAALDAARAGRASEDIVAMLITAMSAPGHKRDTSPWSHFPMPFRGSLAAIQVSNKTHLASTTSSYHDCLETLVNNQTRVHNEAAERLQVRPEPDVCLVVLADWLQKGFNDPDFNTAVHRGQCFAKAKQIDQARENTIYTDDTRQELIKSPFRVMPRRVWDLKSKRVVESRMVHSETLAREYISGGVVMAMDLEKACPTFWAITHSWTNEISPVKTSINQYQPLPRGLDLEYSVRRELLSKGAELRMASCIMPPATVNGKLSIQTRRMEAGCSHNWQHNNNSTYTMQQ
ncbi:ankyrin repeat-containing domain protein [Tirmania nivea]|nr:ankyrin repeat-containing domain protein [Tirmania nivea]